MDYGLSDKNTGISILVHLRIETHGVCIESGSYFSHEVMLLLTSIMRSHEVIGYCAYQGS